MVQAQRISGPRYKRLKSTCDAQWLKWLMTRHRRRGEWAGGLGIWGAPRVEN